MSLPAFALLLLFSAGAATAPAEQPLVEAEPASAPTLETVLVTGDQPGPGLWRVTRGEDDEHGMWVLGTVSPLPIRMNWMSDEVESRIAQSEVFLHSPSLRFDAGVGRFRGLLLVPSLMRARNNPDNKRLQDVLPPEVYERWQVLKARYIGRNRAIERRRPLFVAQELYEKAIDRLGLRSGVVQPVLDRAAKGNGVEVVRPTLEVELGDSARRTIKAFASAPLEDVDCFRQNLAHLESDTHNLILRANAWAEGDIDALRAIPLVDRGPACIEAVFNSTFVAEQGMADLPERLQETWLIEAERVLAGEGDSFAVLPLGLILRADGYLAALARRGYRIESPDGGLEFAGNER